MACDCCPDPTAPGTTTGSPCCPAVGATSGTPCPCCVQDCCCGWNTPACHGTLTVTLSGATDPTLNGQSAVFTSAGPAGPRCTWTSSAGGIWGGASLGCGIALTDCWDFQLSLGVGCTYSGATAQIIDCANCQVTLLGITGHGVSCQGNRLTVTITWAC